MSAKYEVLNGTGFCTVHRERIKPPFFFPLFLAVYVIPRKPTNS